MSEESEFVSGDRVDPPVSASEPQSLPGVLLPNGRRVFSRGDPRIQANDKNNRNGAGLKKRVPVKGEGLLRDMRHVLQNPRSHDKTAGEKACREWYGKDKKGFLLKANDLEELDRDRNRPKDETSGPDLGHDAACKVLDRLLKESAKG